MDSESGGHEHPQPPPYTGDPSGVTEPAYGANQPPYGGTPPPNEGTPPYSGTPPPYAPPGQAPPFGAQGAPPFGAQGAPPFGAQGAPPFGAQGAPPFGAQSVPPFGFPTPAPGRTGLNNRMLAMIGGGVAAVVLVIVLIVVLVGGGGGAGSSPTATVNAFISALFANNGSAVCALAEPSQRASCDASSFTGITGHAQTVGQVIQGDEALVSVTGEFCESGSCTSVTDASTGMPGNGVTFDQAFEAATSSSAGLSPAALVEINGTWYLDSGGS